ncbi:hypothetical protein HD554DRAFT_2189022 [Boletus coccyginus]|nr:hypothetical protein HD554DRAFT_2189022 [Boletus coccyginus]
MNVGDEIPAVNVKEDNSDKDFILDLSGKCIILGAPGAFTIPCSSQVRQCTRDYDKYKTKGVKDIYIVAVNDVLAWKEKLAPQGTGAIRFIAEDKGELMSNFGLIFDASGFYAGRALTFANLVHDNKVQLVAVEDEQANVTVTSEAVLSQIA